MSTGWYSWAILARDRRTQSTSEIQERWNFWQGRIYLWVRRELSRIKHLWTNSHIAWNVYWRNAIWLTKILLYHFGMITVLIKELNIWDQPMRIMKTLQYASMVHPNGLHSNWYSLSLVWHVLIGWMGVGTAQWSRSSSQSASPRATVRMSKWWTCSNISRGQSTTSVIGKAGWLPSLWMVLAGMHLRCLCNLHRPGSTDIFNISRKLLRAPRDVRVELVTSSKDMLISPLSFGVYGFPRILGRNHCPCRRCFLSWICGLYHEHNNELYHSSLVCSMEIFSLWHSTGCTLNLHTKQFGVLLECVKDISQSTAAPPEFT